MMGYSGVHYGVTLFVTLRCGLILYRPISVLRHALCGMIRHGASYNVILFMKIIRHELLHRAPNNAV